MVKATLCYSGISQCGFDSYGKDDEGSYLHHGLASISAYAKSKGFSVDLIDLRKLKGWSDVEKEVKKRDSAVYGLTMNSVDYNYVNKFIDIIKTVNDSLKVVVGGIHPTVMTEEVISNKNIDYIVTREGEISFAELLSDIEEGKKPPRIIKGKVPDLDSIPFVDRELFDGFEVPICHDFEPPFVTIIAARGCPYGCTFCQPAESILFGKKVRKRSVDNVIDEFKKLRSVYNFKSLMIHDDCFTADKKWVEEFCEKYRSNGFDQPFICQSRADFICNNEDLLRKLRDSGLMYLIIGFESGSQQVLNFIRKGVTVEQNLKAAEICRNIGIKIWANYMLGLPTETKEEVMDTVRMIRKMNPDHPSPAYFTPHPGSYLFKYCKENELSLIKDHDNYRRSPRGEKIRGVDYQFLEKALHMSLGYIPFTDLAAGGSKPRGTFRTFIRSFVKKIGLFFTILDNANNQHLHESIKSILIVDTGSEEHLFSVSEALLGKHRNASITIFTSLERGRTIKDKMRDIDIVGPDDIKWFKKYAMPLFILKHRKKFDIVSLLSIDITTACASLFLRKKIFVDLPYGKTGFLRFRKFSEIILRKAL